MKLILSFITLALLAVSPARGESVDSLKICMQAGDSCMREFNTFEALKYYQQAYKMADNRDVRLKLADCYYKRANYGRTTELLKNMPEDSLSHDAFRQLALTYQKQGDLDSYIYWATQLVNRYPMDGEIVAGLTLALAQKTNQRKD
jgi:tetratricopeptide (TPR) repeat protein